MYRVLVQIFCHSRFRGNDVLKIDIYLPISNLKEKGEKKKGTGYFFLKKLPVPFFLFIP
jgi:hypothetical protein